MRSALFAAACVAIALFAGPAFAQDPSELCPTDLSDADLLTCTKMMPERSAGRTLGYANLGSRAYKAGDYQKADEYYARTYPGEMELDVTLHTRRGYIFMLFGKKDLARDDAELAYKLILAGVDWTDGPKTPPSDQMLLLPVIVETLFGSQSKLAEPAAQNYLRRTPEFWGDHMERAVVLSQLGRQVEALAELDIAEKDQPDLPVLKGNRCVFLRRLGRPREALSFCEQAVAAEPDKFSNLVSLMGAYIDMAECDKARVVYANALRRFPDASDLKQPPVCPRPRPNAPI